jgi:hypothetical protein
MIIETISNVNKYLSTSFYIEMSFYKYNKGSLTVVASENLLYYHTLEIIFQDVDFISGKVEWKIDTKKPSFGLLTGEDFLEFNLKYRTLRGYQVFNFLDEDGLYTYIVAKDVSLRINTVKYQ